MRLLLLSAACLFFLAACLYAPLDDEPGTTVIAAR